MSAQTGYRGRFAPSPTGELHFGSLITAVASYLQAKHQQGEWLLRIDDIDPPREIKGSALAILNALEQFGFEWDQDVLYQSSKQQHYQEIISQLLKLKKAYPCSCSRKSILEKIKKSQPQGEIIYPGFCRNGPLKEMTAETNHSIRLRCQQQPIQFKDLIQGVQTVDLEKTRGDFVLKRSDGYFSYQFASAIDDAEQGISEVVRGADLLESTPCQIYVQNVLNFTTPQYCHIPIAINNAGQKLSKQNQSKSINSKNAVTLLFNALQFLGQSPPPELLDAKQNELWQWAIKHWQLYCVPKTFQQEIKVI